MKTSDKPVITDKLLNGWLRQLAAKQPEHVGRSIEDAIAELRGVVGWLYCQDYGTNGRVVFYWAAGELCTCPRKSLGCMASYGDAELWFAEHCEEVSNG